MTRRRKVLLGLLVGEKPLNVLRSALPEGVKEGDWLAAHTLRCEAPVSLYAVVGRRFAIS